MTRVAMTVICVALVFGALPAATPGAPESPGGPAGNIEILHLYLARHGQTDWNAARKLQGGADIPLNATGREQASKLGQLLVGERIDAVYQMIVRALFGLSSDQAARFQQGNDELYLCEIVAGKATRFLKLVDPAR
jgi:hypothetical protein